MDESTTAIIEALDRRADRRNERRDFFKMAGAFGAGAAGAVALTACGGGHSSSSNAQTTTPAPADNDVAILNFALNLEYLEAQFYSFAATGQGLPQSMLTGTGTQGALISTGAGKVPFSNPVVAAYAKEIAQDEVAHVNFLRSALTSAAVASPAIDISATATGSFSTAAQAAGLIPAGAVFSPYANDIAFLLGAFIFEDVGVTAYKGASPLITNKTYLEAAAGILAVEAYHAGIVRTSLFAQGIQMPTTTVGSPPVDLLTATNKIGALRDSLDGAGSDDRGVGSQSAPTLVPVDSNSIAYSRSVGQVLNVVYGTPKSVGGGLFFPNGMNDAAGFTTSAASG